MRLPQLDSRKRGTYRDDHQTPRWLIERVRHAIGSIDIDLASSAAANRIVKAGYYYSAEHPCPEYLSECLRGKAIWCNPPGPAREVIRFWGLFCAFMKDSQRGAFLCFSVDHLRMLNAPRGIKSCRLCLLRQRLDFGDTGSTAPMSSALILIGKPFCWPKLGSWLRWA